MRISLTRQLQRQHVFRDGDYFLSQSSSEEESSSHHVDWSSLGQRAGFNGRIGQLSHRTNVTQSKRTLPCRFESSASSHSRSSAGLRAASQSNGEHLFVRRRYVRTRVPSGEFAKTNCVGNVDFRYPTRFLLPQQQGRVQCSSGGLYKESVH